MKKIRDRFIDNEIIYNLLQLHFSLTENFSKFGDPWVSLDSDDVLNVKQQLKYENWYDHIDLLLQCTIPYKQHLPFITDLDKTNVDHVKSVSLFHHKTILLKDINKKEKNSTRVILSDNFSNFDVYENLCLQPEEYMLFDPVYLAD